MPKHAFDRNIIYLRTRFDGKLQFNLSRLKAKTRVRGVCLRDFLFADRDREPLLHFLFPGGSVCGGCFPCVGNGVDAQSFEVALTGVLVPQLRA